MKLLRRNATEFEYLPDAGLDSDLNDEGEHTGEYLPVSGEPKVFKGNISVSDRNTVSTFYGTDIRYTHVLIMCDPDVEINEYGLIRWKGELYEITAIRRSLNVFYAALQKQTVDHSESSQEEEDGEPEEDGTDGDGE